MRKFEYKFEPLEEFIEDTEEFFEDYDGCCELNIKIISELGLSGFELFQVIMIDGIQYGWFKREIE